MKANQWNGIVVLSSIPPAAEASFPTAITGSPKYGFLMLFATPKTSPVTAIRSSLGAPFGVTSSSGSTRVQPGLLQGPHADAQSRKSADGFAVIVNDASGMRAADLIVSGDSSLSQPVMLRLYSGGVVRASVALDQNGGVSLSSATEIALDAPVVSLSGTLQAQNIEYLPYGGSTEQFL